MSETAEFLARQRHEELEIIAQLEQGLVEARIRLAHIDQLVKKASERPARSAEDNHKNGNGAVSKYRNVGVTEAIIDAVAEIGGKGVSAAQVRDHIIRHGVQTDSKHLLNSVNTALTRLAARQNGKIETQMVQGKRRYFPAQTLFPRSQ